MPKDKPKRKKPQGKLNHEIIIKGLLAGKKKKDIAVEAGSLAKDDTSKCHIITEVVNSEQFKATAVPFVTQLEKQRQRMIDSIGKKELDEEKFRDLSDGIDKFTKNIQLLSGEDTDKSTITVKWDS